MDVFAKENTCLSLFLVLLSEYVLQSTYWEKITMETGLLDSLFARLQQPDLELAGDFSFTLLLVRCSEDFPWMRGS